MRDITLLELLKSGVHFGHQTSKWHPKMKPFLFTSRNGIHIINLEMTLERLRTACDFLSGVAVSGGTVLFVGTKRQAKTIVREAAESCGSPYIVERWLGGFFTNFAVVSRVIKRLGELTADRETGKLEKYTKLERLKFDEEIEKLERLVGGVRTLTKLPDAVFVVDCKAEKNVIRESMRMKVPIAAIVDSNIDPAGIAYPIPANDDATKSIELITRAVAEAVSEGRAVAAKRSLEEAEAAAAKKDEAARAAEQVKDTEPIGVHE